MKNKPIRHKEDNTFKFQPFAERISNIDVDIFHRVPHPNENEETDELQCHFYQTLQKWGLLNLTETYGAFRKEVTGVITLPELVHKKDHVVEVLLRYLRQKNPLALQALLDLVVALAKDLRKDFYDHYQVFLDQLIELLNTKDTDILEWTFTCLAYLFKFLWRYLIKDIDRVFLSLLPLLSNNRPPYINNFAAESFSFVARKVKDRKAFLQLILTTVTTRKDGIKGCGRLLSEVVKGVPGQLHSCAESTLTSYLESLCDDAFPQDVLFEVLEHIIDNVVAHLQPRNTEILWKCLLNEATNNVQHWKTNRTDRNANKIQQNLVLVCRVLDYKSGKMVQSADTIVKAYATIISTDSLPENVLLTLSDLGSKLLIAQNVQLPQDQASSVIRKTLALSNNTVLLNFIQNLTSYSSFEVTILPVLLKHYGQTLNEQCLRNITKLILIKNPSLQCNPGAPTKYNLDFTTHTNAVLNHLLQYLTIENIKDVDFDNFMSALICVPHIHNIKGETIYDRLKHLLGLFVEEVAGDGKEVGEMQRLLFMLGNVVECAIRIGGDQFSQIVGKLSMLDVLLRLVDDKSYTLMTLRIIDMILTACGDSEIISMDTLRMLNGKILRMFSSQFSEIRLLVCHIYSLFENLPQLNTNETINEPFNVFSLCYKVESTPSLVHTYRDQLQLLQKLAYDKPQAQLCKDTEFATVPLRYFLGLLYVNFQLLWTPLIKLVTSHAHGMPLNTFWPVFSMQLTSAVDNIRGYEAGVVHPIEGDLSELYNDLMGVAGGVDYVHYRMLLWKALNEFPDVAEARSRDVSALMLAFVEEEYRKTNVEDAVTWNIKQNAVDVDVDGIDDLAADDKNEDEEAQNMEEKVGDKNLEDDPQTVADLDQIKRELTKSAPQGKSNIKCLLSHLSVFAKIRSPRTMYREPELYKLYLDLLSHRNSDVQKTAFDCIMTYKHKYLVPYQDNLYALIDDRKFKNELTSFRVDKETAIVQTDHRADLIPIVMRIIYSKMMAKTGMRTGGKSSGQLRRSLVLRFIAGCEENEMMNFVHMAFKFYSPYIADDALEMVQDIANAVNLEKIIPPKRLQSTLNLLLVILEQFGGLMSSELLRYVLGVLLVVGATIKGALSDKGSVHSGYLPALRNLRSTSIVILGRFFSRFESYPWTNREIDAVFEVFVWPWLDKLEIEGIHSPTALLKLFHQWAQNPRYFPMLVKHSEGDDQVFALPYVMRLLHANKIHPSVTNMIMEMLSNLLSLNVDENDTNPPLKVDNLVAIHNNILERLKLNDQINYGSCILLPFVPDVLRRLKRKLINKNKSINQRELFILSRISELVWEPEICDSVLSLLFPLAVKRAINNASEETMLQLTTTIHNLTKYVDQPDLHLRKMASLFGEISAVPARKMLSDILDTMALKNADKLSLTVTILREVNAYDVKWIDQPDFQRRLVGFKKIQEMIDADQIDVELGVILIHNCFYVVRNEKDLALRETSSFCLRKIVPYLIHKYTSQADKDYIINDTLLALICRGFRSKNDAYRSEVISLLGHMARECSEAHVVLRDLAKLTNKADLEVDFFENLLHLQLHRKTRALLKISDVFKTLLAPPNPRTLTQFILPLSTMYLLNDKYVSKNSIVDSAIDAVRTVCNLLPWHQYESILKYYLGKLRHRTDFQKQLVRLTVAILDAYHYDISKANLTTEPTDTPAVSTEVVAEKNAEETTEEEPEIHELLDKITEVLEEEAVTKPDVPAVLRTTVLCPSAAKRVLYSISTILLPQLHKTMAEMTMHEGSHKVNRKRTGAEREEEELQKVPLSLAVVKLLQKLPEHIMERNLPGVFMKLCSFLTSPLESVRRTTRETLQKIMTALGPKYLGLLLSEMSTLLSRGFQVHVLVYTMHSILNALKDHFQPTDIDKCLLTILALCKVDLFGALAEEKEVAKIGNKVSEAKSTKSFDTFQILAQYISANCMMDLISPLQEILKLSHNFKVVQKVQESLRRVVLGLIDNTFIPVEALLTFAYGTSAESIPNFIESNKKPKLTEAELEKKSREKPDCYIIPKAPVGKSGIRQNYVCVSAKTNSHLLVEFGLRLCYFLLKRDKVEGDDYEKYIDPFVNVFKNCLSSRHVKIATLTIQCLSWIFKYEMPVLKENIENITSSIFDLLHKYAVAGLSKGDNYDLVVAAFKAMAILVRDVKYYTITPDQLKALLLYAEQDLHDFERQATAFALLKSIISRKLTNREIHEVMAKVAELSITSDAPHVRQNCRQVFHHFFMEYPLGKRIEKHLAFFVSQLNYESQPGRESAIEMLQNIIQTLPIVQLREQSGMLFVMLGASVVNDDSPDCRKKVAKCIHTLLERLSKADRDVLFDILLTWFNDTKVTHRQMAAQLCGILITVEKLDFECRLPEIVPVILTQLTPGAFEGNGGRFVRIAPPSTEVSETEQKLKDHHLFQVMQMMLKICAHCPSFLKHEEIENISINVQILLAYPHEWVRLGATQFLGYVLSRLDIEHLSELITNDRSDEKGYLYSDPRNMVKSLILDLVAQLQAGAIQSELAEQVIKNLVFLARVLENVPMTSEEFDSRTVTLFWLTKRMRKVVNMEVVVASRSTVLRTEVFKWIAGVITTINKDKLIEIIHHLLAPLVREMISVEQTNAPLRQLAKEVGALLRKKVGNDLYLSTLSKIQMQLNVRRAERKRERLQMVVTDPDVAARKKIKLQEKKKEAKKRKMEGIKGKKVYKKKRKLEDLDVSEVA